MRLARPHFSAQAVVRACLRVVKSLSARARLTVSEFRREPDRAGPAGQRVRRARLHTSVIEGARTGLRVVMSHKVRSFLTMLGIVMGVGGIVGIVSIAESAKGMLVAQLDDLVGGANMFGVFRPPFFFDDGELTINYSDEYLTYEDALALEDRCEFVTHAIPQVEHGVRASVGFEGRHVPVMGTSPAFSPGMKWFTRLGRSMRYSDAASEAKVCILGLRVARYLFQANVDPVGREIRLDDSRYVVVGVMDDKDEDNDKRIIVPVTTAQNYMTGSDEVGHLWVKTTSIDTVDAARGQASAVLSQRHGGEDFFRTWSLKDILKYINKMIFVLQIAIGGLAATSLLVGGIGIMNVMLASVNERTYEVGLRKAVGARRADIMFQFLVEAVVLSLMGGAGGIGIGLGVTRAVAWFMDTVATPPQPWLPLVSVPAVVFAIAACATVGLFFGIYPARRASRLTPVDALRYE